MKQVIVVRSDLKLSKGKLAAQVAHASLNSALVARKKKKLWFTIWSLGGQKKVVLKGKDEAHLLELKKKADQLGLPNALISDAGHTELPPGTITCLGIGPAPDDKINKITGNLPLL